MILAILQARCSSSRLPNKVIKNILGTPMLIHQINRIKKSRLIDKLVVATTDDSTDDTLVKILEENNIEYYRGSLNDVLDRFYSVAQIYNPDHVVRLTGDCPLTDWDVIDNIINVHLENNNDYTCNCLEYSFPDGLDVEVMKYDILKKAWENAKLPSQREHVTLYINRNKKFKIENIKNKIDLSMYRWTVDEEADYSFVKAVYERLYKKNQYFTMNDVLKLLEEDAELFNINSMFGINEGLIKSLNKENDLLKEGN